MRSFQGGDEGDLNDRDKDRNQRNPVWGPVFITSAVTLVIIIAIAAALALF